VVKEGNARRWRFVPEVLVALEAKRPHEDRTEAQVVDSELLREPLARLPGDQRRALVLAAFYGFTAREISGLDGSRWAR
jgi:DNA-directed RNA polymerase specialized sigma24 family protein